MYSYIKGTLEEILDDTIVVETGGIGYNILASGQVYQKLPPLGSEIKVYTYSYVREDQLSLFGFASRDELSVFRLLIGVSGIGPKAGLTILSGMSADDLRFAVVGEDVKAIERIPGVGKKTAQRLIIELKDKLSLTDAFENALEKESLGTAPLESGDLRSEAIMALTALGYGSQEATKAVRAVPVTEDATVESILKGALKNL